MNMKPLIAIVLLLSVAHTQVSAQEEEEPKTGFDKSRLFGGGGFGLSFGDYTLVNVSPQIGYHFNQYLAAGAGVNFIYSSFKYYAPQYRENYGVAGLNIFGRAYPIQFAFVQLQPEMNYVWGKYKFYDGTPDLKLNSKFVPSLLGGAGASIPTGGGGGAFIIMVQYDLLQNERSPYGNRAFFNFGYNFGF